VIGKVGKDLARPMVSRGAAYLDADGDGDPRPGGDREQRPRGAAAQRRRQQNRWLRVKLVGTKSNKDGIGAKVTVKLPGGATRWGVVKTGSSYCSQSELPLTFGLGTADKVDVGRGRLAERAARQAGRAGCRPHAHGHRGRGAA
jgi:hypothetical protein